MRGVLTVLILFAGIASAVAEPAMVTRNVPYGDLKRQALDLYMPAVLAEDAPALVFFYGGSWQRGDRKDLKATAESLVAAGMIVAVPDYRLYPQVVFPAFVEDCAAAVARVRALLDDMGGNHPLFIGGHSAGAFNAALLAADERYLTAAGVPPDAVAGYVLLSGPYNMSDSRKAPYPRLFPMAARDRTDVNAFIDGSEPPMLLMTVDADRTVTPLSTDRLARTVMVHGGRAVVATYKGSDHMATFRGLSRPDSAVRKDLAAFIAAVAAE